MSKSHYYYYENRKINIYAKLNTGFELYFIILEMWQREEEDIDSNWLNNMIYENYLQSKV